MRGLTKKRSDKAGLPPGSLVHIGEKVKTDVKTIVIDYDEAGFEERELSTVSECFTYKDKPSITWINVEGIHDTGTLERLGGCFGIHPLTLEDILNTDQRPKIEEFEEYIYIVLKMLYFKDGNKSNEVITEQVSLIVGGNFVISFQEGIKGDAFNNVRERLRTSKGRIRKQGADYLAYSLVDAVVDNYFIVLERLGEDIEAIEDELVSRPTPQTLKKIHGLKRQLLLLHRSVRPLREVAGGLTRRESPLIKESTVIYLRDVYDHAIHANETIETFREMLSEMMDIYLLSVNNRMGSVMKVFTFIATIFMPLTFIAGIYGMNFKYMPELQWRWGYPLALGIMLGVAAVMLVYFKRKKWL